MSPRSDATEPYNPFNDVDGWIRASNSLLASLFRMAVKDLKMTDDEFTWRLDKFIEDPLHGIGRCSQERSTFKGNTTKDLKNNSPTWNKFLFLMKVLGFKSLHFHVTLCPDKGHPFTDKVFIPLEGVNIIGDDLQIDPRNLPSQQVPQKIHRKLLKEHILNSDTKYLDLALDEMTFLIRSNMMSAGIDLKEWNTLINEYVSHLDRAKRCTERNNFASQILFTQTSSWKTYKKFLSFIKARAIRIDIGALDSEDNVRHYQIGSKLR